MIQFGSASSRLINFIINEVLPPFIRDSFLMKPLFYFAFGGRAKKFIDFRDQYEALTPEAIASIYQETAACDLKKDSDISGQLIDRILAVVSPGQSLLDVGCGRGRLIDSLSSKCSVYGVDLAPAAPAGMRGRYLMARVESLPFRSDVYDVVVCAHVLEHVPDIFTAIAELRRVATKRLIIVLPVERPYRFGFNLHLWFFRYRLNVLQVLMPKAGSVWSLDKLRNEWIYIEELD